jgi:two-component system phosphate regulon response regulator PhoB
MDRILIIEDDPDIAHSLQYALERTGEFSATVARNGESGLQRALEAPPDLVLLDLNLPGIDGVEVCRQLRGRKGTLGVPIIMVTARVAEEDRVVGLDLGADDYVTKPFSIKEVLARIRALLRRARTPPDPPTVESLGVLEVDTARRSVNVEGQDVTLTRKEFDLLADLLRHRGRVASRDQLLQRVWGYDHVGTTRTVDVHIRQLRKKLGPAADYIETVVGVGYRVRREP